MYKLLECFAVRKKNRTFILLLIFFISLKKIRERCQKHFSHFPGMDETKEELEMKEDKVVYLLAKQACTFLETGDSVVHQMTYKVSFPLIPFSSSFSISFFTSSSYPPAFSSNNLQCLTCNILDDQGVCESCATSCHANHTLSTAGLSLSYCDCHQGSCACRSPLPAPLKRTTNPYYGMSSTLLFFPSLPSLPPFFSITFNVS
jgi:hypothetical protein